MILHLVALDLTEGADREELASIMAGLSALRSTHEGWIAFDHGQNIDVEHLSDRYTYALLCTFKTRAALDAYAEDPAHKALGARLVSLCNDTPGKIMVFDIDTERPAS